MNDTQSQLIVHHHQKVHSSSYKKFYLSKTMQWPESVDRIRQEPVEDIQPHFKDTLFELQVLRRSPKPCIEKASKLPQEVVDEAIGDSDSLRAEIKLVCDQILQAEKDGSSQTKVLKQVASVSGLIIEIEKDLKLRK